MYIQNQQSQLRMMPGTNNTVLSRTSKLELVCGTPATNFMYELMLSGHMLDGLICRILPVLTSFMLKTYFRTSKTN
jgi:hypothetical protein